MKLIIWTAEMKSNEGWSSQLWTQYSWLDFETFCKQQEGFQRAFCRKIKKIVKFSQKYALNISMRGILDTTKTHDCERNLSPMILIGNKMVHMYTRKTRE